LLVALSLPRSHADLSGWWTVAEEVGTPAADASPAGAPHAAVLESGASFIGSGKFGGAVTLDGVNDIVRISDHAAFEFDQKTSFTLAFWFRTTWNFPDTRGFIAGLELALQGGGRGSPGTDDAGSLITWLASYGLGVGSELTDPDHDQLTVLVEDVLGGSPASNDMNLHPGITLQELSVGGLVDAYAVMTFTRNNAAEGVTITPEVSRDLVSLQEITEVLTRDPSAQAGLDLISVRVADPISSGTRLFVRLRVETK
jgi:hypothetical protein